MPENNSIVYIILLASILLAALVFFIVFALIQYQKAKGVHVEEMEQLKEKVHKEKLTAELEIKEQTLDNISQEIHDNIGQVLSLAKINLKTVPENENINESLDHIETVISSIRGISHLISSNKLENAVMEDLLQKEVDQINRTGVLHAELQNSTKDYLVLDREKSFILYRMIQECIHNVIKHARAKNMILEISDHRNGYLFSLKDNGEGFNIDENKNGNGMQNLKRRAELIDADFDIESVVNEGTEIKIFIENGKA